MTMTVIAAESVYKYIKEICAPEQTESANFFKNFHCATPEYRAKLTEVVQRRR